jgi:hypothetical protein
MSHFIKWTESEINILRKNYFMELGDLSKKLDRTEEDIASKMVFLGIIKSVEDANGYIYNIFLSFDKIWHRFMLKLRPKYTLKQLMDIHTEKNDPYVRYSELYLLVQELENRIEQLENK